MEELILNEFEKGKLKTNEIIPLRNLRFGLLSKLNPKQQDQAADAINSLITKEYITYEDGTQGIECIRLTQGGFDALYQKSMSVDDIEKQILSEFEDQNSRAGSIVMLKKLNFGLLQNLNPKEKSLFNDAIQNLIDKEMITYESGSLECLRLTEKGYDALY
ncbi:hypothetical protein [Sphingobacterium sp. MYb382]|uniref:hypothetical protein n=1 Tax=Sphingobacterium sp. MYb382 TaxID=2745278 RepID=UPI0030A31C77